MLCSYFISKLYLKLTGFLFLIFPSFLLTMLAFFKLILNYFCSLCYPWQLLIAVYLVVKVSYWSILVPSSFCVGKKDENTKKIQKRISTPTVVCQYNEHRVR